MPYRREFTLPPVTAELVSARNRLREHYTVAGLKFTLDGNLVGDIGEAVAAELFGIKLIEANGTGIDGRASDGRSVQVKATGTGRGPVFRCVDTRADHLLFFDIDFDNLRGKIIFNGPEYIALSRMPEVWIGQRPVSKVQIRAADALVPLKDRLRRIDF
ncbi:hypothetical protein [Mesorhizobium sp. B2-3-15]|uniref:DUF6998 domain-containing protein n=1 Tax=Mesorhizobium sp. B2-3-15 TaxID=2589949 RepID=UPI00112DB533|nr:hypothetical protein [Mesorhizobium sp. B2-3-15]TPL62954.1 hypothetical protein FJ954_31265 [Mesorhizobium sp. B2-3-15]